MLLDPNPQFDSPQKVQSFLTDVIRLVHAAGWFISGCVTVDQAVPCSCGHQMKLVCKDNRLGLWGRVCPKCDSAGGQHVTITPPRDPPPVNPLLAALSNADCIACAKCGEVALRRGTCYVCNGCGETSSCS